MFHVILLVQVLATWILDPASRCRFVLLQILCICNYFITERIQFVHVICVSLWFRTSIYKILYNVFVWGGRIRWRVSFRSFHIVICAVWCPRISPHFPALPRTGFPAFPSASPHFPALPRTSPHFIGFLWICRLGRDQDIVFLWFTLVSLATIRERQRLPARNN